jgi:hypothetical protein
MTQKFGALGESIVGVRPKGRPRKARPLKPTAPFDRDHEKAVALAFDRDTGESIPATALKTYAEALAQYHIQPESKSLNADYLDRGTTVRRHVRMTGTHHIGKESHDWERQAMLGLNLDSEIAYGVSASDVLQSRATLAQKAKHTKQLQLREAVELDGLRATARSLGIDPSNLRRMLRRFLHAET